MEYQLVVQLLVSRCLLGDFGLDDRHDLLALVEDR